MPLQHKYRPKTWKDVIGNKTSIAALRIAVMREEDRPHAYLISGPAGCGKTTLSRIIASELGATEMDLCELNTADFRGIDMIRELRKNSFLNPMYGKARVWILDEAHQISPDGQEAALKMLEEPPPQSYFCLATTEPQKLKPTLIRRCHHCELKAVSRQELEKLIEDVWKKEVDDALPEFVAPAIASKADGSPGVALAILDRVIELDEKEMLLEIQKGELVKTQSIELCRLLIKGSGNWKKIAAILKGLKSENPERVRQHVMAYMSSVLLGGNNSDAGTVLLALRDNETYNSGWPGLIGTFYEMVSS